MRTTTTAHQRLTRVPPVPVPARRSATAVAEPPAVEGGGEPDRAARPLAHRHPQPGRAAGHGGVVLLLFVVYELWVTDLLNAQAQSTLDQSLHDQWGSSAPLAPGTTDQGPFAVGQAFAILHIPRLGADYSRVVVEGTDQDQLAQGPGHYVGTAFPGSRATSPWPGTGWAGARRSSTSTRCGRATRSSSRRARAGSSTACWAMPRPATSAPTPAASRVRRSCCPPTWRSSPRHPTAPATAPASGSYLTLTTCHPRFSARQRLVVHAKLDGAGTSKADQPHGPAGAARS